MLEEDVLRSALLLAADLPGDLLHLDLRLPPGEFAHLEEVVEEVERRVDADGIVELRPGANLHAVSLEGVFQRGGERLRVELVVVPLGEGRDRAWTEGSSSTGSRRSTRTAARSSEVRGLLVG